MTIDEVIEEITESGLNLGAGDFVDVEALKDAVKYLKEYKEMQWISVKDRLPEKDVPHSYSGDVFVTNGKKISSGYYSYPCESWFTYYDDVSACYISHWMPIPEPPTNKEDK